MVVELNAEQLQCTSSRGRPLGVKFLGWTLDVDHFHLLTRNVLDQLNIELHIYFDIQYSIPNVSSLVVFIQDAT